MEIVVRGIAGGGRVYTDGLNEMQLLLGIQSPKVPSATGHVIE